MRVLTLDNMDEVQLQGTFDYVAIEPDVWEAFYIRQDRLRRGVKETISLGDVYRLFASGLNFHEVKEFLEAEYCDHSHSRNISNKTVLLGQAFYRAVNPGIPHFNRSNVIRALCDENLDEYLATDAAQRVFGYASHTTFEKLTGKPDSRVWRRALDFDVIISKDTAQKSSRTSEEDRDLTNCAEDAWKEILARNGGVIDDEIRALPIIIHVKDAQADGRQIKKMLKKHKHRIYELIQQRKSPVIELKKGRTPQIGKHYLELIDGGTEVRKRRLVNAQLGVFMRMNVLDLTREEKIEFRARIREVIQDTVDKIEKDNSNPEKRVPLLDRMISQSDGVLSRLILDKKTLEKLKRSIDSERVQIERRKQREAPRLAYMEKRKSNANLVPA
jgi:hypothetical protein